MCCDVTTAYVDAAREFGPQKGADAHQVAELTRRLDAAQQLLLRRYGLDVSDLAGAGAAGGLAGGLAAAGGRLRPGFALVADRIGLAGRIRAADLVLTGEGRLDRTSFAGKVVGGVLAEARGARTDAAVVAGSVSDDVAGRANDEAGAGVVSLVADHGAQRAHDDVLACVETSARGLVSGARPGRRA